MSPSRGSGRGPLTPRRRGLDWQGLSTWQSSQRQPRLELLFERPTHPFGLMNS
jgi:hypothetical protein